MQQNGAYKFAPTTAGEKKIDLKIENAAAEIKLSSWIEGLGWCGEKTMKLDLEMVEEMERVLTAARLRLRRDAAENGDQILSAKILEFPSFA